MPGIVVFKRRWSVGSDDLVVPAVFLVILHIAWIIVLSVTISVIDFNEGHYCSKHLYGHLLGYLVILSLCVLLEGSIAWLSMQGSILDTYPRMHMQYLLYARLGILGVELAWLIIGVVWIADRYNRCSQYASTKAVFGIIVCNWAILLSVIISLWCTFDSAGRSWVKMKRFQESVKEREPRHGQRRRQSGSRRRNWRQRKAMRAYEQSWDRRCNVLFCCVKEDRHKNSFTEVAKLFTEFFRDLDVVPSDIVAGFALLRKHQKLRRKIIVAQGNNDVYQYLSGVPITPETQFLSLKEPDVLSDYKRVIHYMRYALAAYGWPMYMMMNTTTGLCKILPHLSCCCLPCFGKKSDGTTVEDNCCECNIAALRKLSGLKELDLVYATYHVDIGETPFFIAVDHEHKAVVLSVRGTLSLQDVLTDLKADAEQLPVHPPREDWLGHKGMVQNAVYIKTIISEKSLLAQAFNRDVERGTPNYDLVLVGHSLGAGTAAILAILLKQEYPHLHCYSYSPPGGLLSKTTVEETKHFITSVIVGKDVVGRIGLHQLEATRQDLLHVIKHSNKSKWRIIGSGMFCCGHENVETDGSLKIYEAMKHDKETRNFQHPNDAQIALTQHNPLYPPGKIIHIVRNHPKCSDSLCGSVQPVYQAIWASNTDFDEVLISPTMVQDHMPDKVFAALQKVIVNVGPAKPSRKLTEVERKALLSDTPLSTQDNTLEQITPQSCSKVYAETSFSNPSNTDEDINRSSAVSEDNSLSWDYTSPVRKQQAERQSYACSRQMKPKRNFKLDFVNGSENWCVVPAPLATPETLSESSSIDSNSYGSRRSGGYQKLIMGMPTMEPIQQSPLRQQKSDGYNYFIQAPSPVEYGDSPEREFTPINNVPLAQSTPAKHPTITTEATVEYCAGGDTLSNLSNELPLDHVDYELTHTHPPTSTHTTPYTSTHTPPPSSPHTPPPSSPHILDSNRLSNSSTRFSNDCPQTDLNLDCEDNEVNENFESRNKSPDKYNVTFEDENTKSSFNVNNAAYVRHSPDTPDSYSYQIGYDLQGSHYSHGGRGYPHGAYMAVEIPDPGIRMTPETSPNNASTYTKWDKPSVENGCVTSALLPSSDGITSSSTNSRKSTPTKRASVPNVTPSKRVQVGCITSSSPKHNPNSYHSYSLPECDDVFTTEDMPILEESFV